MTLIKIKTSKVITLKVPERLGGKESLRLFGSLGKGSDRPKKEGGLPRQHYHFMAREP